MPALGLHLVRPLEEAWRDTLDLVAKRRGWPTSKDVASLAACVADLSKAYNDPRRARATVRDAGAARLGFGFARDVPKGAGAVRELIATGRLRLGDEPLHVLDLGAGLGAATWGVVRALEAAGMRGVVEADWVDSDAAALELGSEVVRARVGAGAVELRVRASASRIDAQGGRKDKRRYDLVLASHVLSELDVGAPAPVRLEQHASLIADWLENQISDAGSLVVVEPALRDRTRHLHAVRDSVLRMNHANVGVFAPCLHRQSCPALARETDWCHEDLPVDLPPWLVPVARAAGLRREGLTFSYLVLRRDGVSLASELVASDGVVPLRVVSGALPSKGKKEAFVCGEFRQSRDGDGLVAGWTRLVRLNRDANDGNKVWDGIERGDLLAIRPVPDLIRARIGPDATIEIGAARAHLAPAVGFSNAEPNLQFVTVFDANRVDVPVLRRLPATIAMRGLYAIVDVGTLRGRRIEPTAFAEALLRVRPAALQLRVKDLPARETLALMRELAPMCHGLGVPLVANDRPDLAVLAGCDWVHIGQTDMPIERVRRITPSLGVGVSTHTPAQLDAALAARPLYVAYGPVFETTTKSHPDPVVGVSGIRDAHSRAMAAGVPLVAIGGITRERARDLVGWVDAVAVVADLLPPAGASPASLTDVLREVTARARALHEMFAQSVAVAQAVR